VSSQEKDDGLAVAKRRANRELGERFAELLSEKNSHQLGVCAKLGIPYRTHAHWMAQEAEPGSDIAEYQSAVLAGLDAARRADLDDIDLAIDESEGSHVGTVWNSRKHRHDSRFKRFYEPDTQKVELTGKDGAPIDVRARPMTRAEALVELKQMLASDPELLEVTAGNAVVAGLLSADAGGEDGGEEE